MEIRNLMSLAGMKKRWVKMRLPVDSKDKGIGRIGFPMQILPKQ